MKGILCYVFENKALGNSSNGGISTKYSRVVLTGPGIPEVSQPNKDAPEVVLQSHNWGRTKRDWSKATGHHGSPYLFCVPARGKDPKQLGWMFGGTFVYTSDARFPSLQPIPLHDRQESQELNSILSK